MNPRVQLIADLVLQKLALESLVLLVNTLERTVDLEDPAAMADLNQHRRRLAERYVSYGSMLSRLCDSYDTQGQRHASCN